MRVRQVSVCLSEVKSGRTVSCGLAPFKGMTLVKGENRRKGVAGRKRLEEGRSCALLWGERKAELVKQWWTFGLVVCDEQEGEAQHLAYLMYRLNSMPLHYSLS